MYKNGLFTNNCKTPIGDIVMASDGIALVGLWFVGQKYFGSTIAGKSERRNLPVFDDTMLWLDIYFSGNNPDFTPKIRTTGTVFQENVWNIIKNIPYSSTMTYGDISKSLGFVSSLSARAVGNAVGRNPISLIIPCHRVLGTNNKITGYAGGEDKKRYLLQIESV
ncbi:MAG TPA: methylated-DNA--[protein]-cysteine S-methyltransferase [Bacteroidetes bacterium]|nr:methylated-DNA--[protein]-cysteine S-methyltransferase [Candidatus Limimorpha avicola]